jgi:FAD/FMN-containing dehydrogenase
MTRSSPSSWGNLPKTSAQTFPLHNRQADLPKLPAPLLPYGLGRSYGDSCLNDGGTLLLTRGLDHWMAFDPESGSLTCEGGISLDEILRNLSPRGWFLPVTPGTRFVTVGGAIANDVHGKNHHRTGNFSSCVMDFELLRSDGSRQTCSREKNSDLFKATVGGLGLTGLITWARLKLRKISSPMIEVEQIRMRHLGEFFALADASHESHEYTVAWVDGLAGGARAGSGIFIRGNHSPETEDLAWRKKPALSVPIYAPGWVLQKPSVKAFNALYSRKFKGGSHEGREHFLPFFYPLDAVNHWNRLYGKRGFYQYQCVVPREGDGGPIKEILERIAKSGQASFLAVLKVFGEQKAEGMLSFPRPGVTLAMDFPNNGQASLELMQQLDDVVRQANGALYPAKDARMSAEDFRRFNPQLDAFKTYIDPAFSSSFWRRMVNDG